MGLRLEEYSDAAVLCPEAQICKLWLTNKSMLQHPAGSGTPGQSNIHLLQFALQALQNTVVGGAGFVPDIASLQAWLECAWNAGFDQLGAEQLGRSVQVAHLYCTRSTSGNMTELSAIKVAPQLGPLGCLQASRKWIGTTECATLLRYWGVRAHIVDFKAGMPWQAG